MTVRRGRTVALVGESGSGKSTLAKVITGLLPQASGTVTFAGKKLAPSLRDRSLLLQRDGRSALSAGIRGDLSGAQGQTQHQGGTEQEAP